MQNTIENLKKTLAVLKIQNFLLYKTNCNENLLKFKFLMKWVKFILDFERKNFNDELNDINIVLNENLVRENFFRTKFKLLFSES